MFYCLAVISLFSVAALGSTAKPCSIAGQHLSCSSASLSSIPQLPASLTHLDLHDNHIETLDYTNLQRLIFLDLSYNLISGIDTAVSQLQSVQYLNISDNQVQVLPLTLLCDLPQLAHLNLAHNLISEINFTLNGTAEFTDNSTSHNESHCTNPSLLRLDLSGNQLSQLPEHFLQGLAGLQWLNLSHNLLPGLPANWSQSLASLRVIDLSHNLLSHLDADAFSHLHALTQLYVNHNNLSVLSVLDLPGLSVLSLSDNPLTTLPVFSHCSKLHYLHLSNLHIATIDHLTFRGLHELQVLNLSGCWLQNLHSDIFLGLQALHLLDLSHNSLSVLYEDTFHNTSAMISIQGNPLHCDCELFWLYQRLTNTSSHFVAPENTTCQDPPVLQGLPLAYLDESEFVCSAPLITNYTLSVQFPVGSSVVLDCVTSGSPRPSITWITPRNQVLRYDPAYVHWGSPQPHDSHFHAHHHWHSDPSKYFDEVDQHLHVLHNGSLYIDYVKRTDAGNYTCYVENDLGNDTVLMEFKLNYKILLHNVAFSVLVGYASAGCFFLTTVLVAVLRYVSYQCSREQRQKRKSIYQMLESLENYRAASLDKLRDYKSAKIDQLSAYKTAKVDKLRNYKNLYYTTVVSYMEKMRENYSISVNRIKDNCRQQVEHLRDNYSMQKGKFKDYRSHQMDRLQENYHTQVLKVKEYGASQVARLREQYKLQQQHIMKIVEILDVGSCMTVIEAECMRTESMLFDDLDFDLDTVKHSSESDEKEMDVEKGMCGPPAIFRPSYLPVEGRKAKRKHKFRRHRRQPSNISTDTSISQGTPELIPVKAEVLPYREATDETVLGMVSSPSAYITASGPESTTEYESANSHHSSLEDISERRDRSPSLVSSSSQSTHSTPTLRADGHFVVTVDGEDATSLHSSLHSPNVNEETCV